VAGQARLVLDRGLDQVTDLADRVGIVAVGDRQQCAGVVQFRAGLGLGGEAAAAPWAAGTVDGRWEFEPVGPDAVAALGEFRGVCCIRRKAQPSGRLRGVRPVRRSCPVVPARSAFGGFRFPPEVIVLAVRWYLRFGLSYRDVEELLAERGIEVDHVTVYRWVQRFAPLLADAARLCRHAAGDRWFVDETHVKVSGQ